MPLSWNEIRQRAINFSREWQGETREAAGRQSFWNDFFNVFGVRRRTVATFEEPVRKLSGDWGFIDLFWPGRLLAEHKSAGEDLGKAHAQGMAYIRGLKHTGRDREIPRWLSTGSSRHHWSFTQLTMEAVARLAQGRKCCHFLFTRRLATPMIAPTKVNNDVARNHSPPRSLKKPTPQQHAYW